MSEAADLDAIARAYDPSDPAEQFDYWLKRLQARTIAPHLAGGRVLELGCATGELTSLLVPLADTYTVVEGSATNIATAAARLPDVEFVHSLWDDYTPGATFSDIVAFNAIEHAPEPVSLLARTASWLEPGGRLHVVVPNGLSLHRLVGVERGMLAEPTAVTPGDAAQGHLRNYTPDTITADIRAAGYEVLRWEGIFLKLVPNREMLGWEWDLICAVDQVAKRLPEHAAEIYVCAAPRRPGAAG